MNLFTIVSHDSSFSLHFTQSSWVCRAPDDDGLSILSCVPLYAVKYSLYLKDLKKKKLYYTVSIFIAELTGEHC